jgi:hypothetical protein
MGSKRMVVFPTLKKKIHHLLIMVEIFHVKEILRSRRLVKWLLILVIVLV